jgi:hypothetical protein
MFPQKILLFIKIYTDIHLSNWDLDYMIPKRISQTSIPDPKYTLENEITNSRDHLCNSYLEIWISWNTVISKFRLEICCSLFPMLTDEFTEYLFYCKRAILFLSSSKILTPPSPSPPGESVLPPQQRWGYTLAGRRGGWGGASIFWKTREIGLPSYRKICTLGMNCCF